MKHIISQTKPQAGDTAELCDTETSSDESAGSAVRNNHSETLFYKVGRRRRGFGSENKRERQIRIIVNSGGD